MVAAENRDKQASESLWLLSLPVDDVDRVVALVKKRGGKGQVYRHHHDYGSRWGDRIYDRDRIIVVPRDVAPAIEATPLPSEPDMGMPDMGGDMRGDDFLWPAVSAKRFHNRAVGLESRRQTIYRIVIGFGFSAGGRSGGRVAKSP